MTTKRQLKARIRELEQGIEEQHGRITELTDVVASGLVAVHLTRQYVGEERLPALDGWSWFDWTQKAERALTTTELATS